MANTVEAIMTPNLKCVIELSEIDRIYEEVSIQTIPWWCMIWTVNVFRATACSRGGRPRFLGPTIDILCALFNFYNLQPTHTQFPEWNMPIDHRKIYLELKSEQPRQFCPWDASGKEKRKDNDLLPYGIYGSRWFMAILDIRAVRRHPWDTYK